MRIWLNLKVKIMQYNYQYKITFKLNEPFDVKFVNDVCNQHSNSRILVEVQNTKGITSSMIRQLSPNIAVRIAGAYDEERIAKYKGRNFGNEDVEAYYYDSVIYSRNECVKILEEIEDIEYGLNRNWSDIQKLVYIYDRLKSGIMYDPKHEQKFSRETRSLRGLLTKQTICAGYSLIFKEFMDRNNIKCEFARGGIVSGKVSGHAWNIVTIDGKKYPIDLTWDNTAFRKGIFNSFDWLGADLATFIERHHPAPEEKTQDYEHTLSQFDPQLIKQIYNQIGAGRARNYQSTTYYGTRKDGSRFIVAQIGNNTINNKDYYRYYYVEIAKDGKKQLPLILYSETNVTHLINSKKYGKPIPPKYEEAVEEILFSKENIADSIAKKTYYIGKVRKDNAGNGVTLVTSPQEIQKPEDQRNLFVYPTRRFTRSDGSVFIAQQMFDKPRNANGVKVMRYDIFEMVTENGNEVLRKNTVFTERNFFKDTRQSMVDEYLSRGRLDRKVSEAGGYIGYYDANGTKVYNPDLVKYFSTSKKIDLASISKKDSKTNKSTMQIPSFSELKALAAKYEIYIDSNDPYDTDESKVKIRDIQTGNIPTDRATIAKALFANIWLSAAGIAYYDGEARPGESYAFNDPARELYNIICNQLLSACRTKGVVDTIDLFRNIDNSNSYKYNKEIIVNLFKTPYQTQIINRLFLESLGIKQSQEVPETLYSMSYAGSLAFDSGTVSPKSR